MGVAAQRPRRLARTAETRRSAHSLSGSFAKVLPMCLRTAAPLTTSVAAIAVLVRPSPISASTSRSRAVRPARGLSSSRLRATGGRPEGRPPCPLGDAVDAVEELLRLRLAVAAAVQREDTNGLLRQYFPKGTDLSVHLPAHLLDVGDELNGRPRRVLQHRAPIDLFTSLLASARPATVATLTRTCVKSPGWWGLRSDGGA